MTIVQRDFDLACSNWWAWRDVFEHRGRPTASPLFEPRRFSRFLDEYNVRRTVREDGHEPLRELLLSPGFPLVDVLADCSGAALEQEEAKLRKFGSKDQSSVLSLFSKVAAFLAPDRFTAWDTYGRKGLNIVLGRAPTKVFSGYVAYLGEMNRLLATEIGAAVQGICAGRYPTSLASQGDGFHRRVLDICLMRLGGRFG